MKRISTLIVTGLAAAALATGCSSAVTNQGGDTKCSDFTSSDEKTQNETTIQCGRKKPLMIVRAPDSWSEPTKYHAPRPFD